MYKNICMVLNVPDSKYCWEFFGEHSICNNINNETGINKCEILHKVLEEDKDGVLKCEECLGAKEIKK